MSESTGRPGRYQRSAGGLIGAMLVLVIAVFGYVLFREAIRPELKVDPEAVDFMEYVDLADQELGLALVHPDEVPSGWMATSVDLDANSSVLSWRLGLLTEDQRFAGLRQTEESLMTVLADELNGDPVSGATVELPGAVAREWQSFSTAGGRDHAFATELQPGEGDSQVLVVYGSASVDDLQKLIGTLTLGP